VAENSSKGNPASHRMSNKSLQSRRQASWNRGQTRREKNKEANREAHLRNEAIRKRGPLDFREAQAIKSGTTDWSELLTPHEAKRLKRKLVRDNQRAKGQIPRTEKEWHDKHPQRATGKVTVQETDKSNPKNPRKTRAKV